MPDTTSPRQIAIVSGGFDPIHSGHVAMILECTERRGADEVWVILNSNDWLVRKKGRFFMTYAERAAVVGAMRGVTRTVMAADEDGTVAETIRDLVQLEHDVSPATRFLFCNGGDRTDQTTPEQAVCQELGVGLAFGVGGGKTQSSSDILGRWREA